MLIDDKEVKPGTVIVYASKRGSFGYWVGRVLEVRREYLLVNPGDDLPMYERVEFDAVQSIIE